MSVSGTSEVRVEINSVVFYLKLHLVKGIVGDNSEDYGEVWFGEEGITVV